jgi:hypothetical protein
VKRLILLLLLCPLIPAQPWAAAPWETTDVVFEGVYLTLHAVDWGQTLDIASRGDRYHERNPLLGRHPTRGEVNTYFALTAAAHVALAHWLEPPYRAYFQLFTIALEASVTAANYRIGLRTAF